MPPHEPLLAFESVSKSFGAVRALTGVSFSIAAGEVRALLGENGAGKSTLLKALSGAHAPDSGAIRIGGATQRFDSTQDAFRAGVAGIYQQLQPLPRISVRRN